MQRCAYFLEVFQNTISSFHCGQISVRNPTQDTLPRPLKASEIEKHCVKSVLIRSYSGPYFPAFWLNTERYGVYVWRTRLEGCTCGNLKHKIAECHLQNALSKSSTVVSTLLVRDLFNYYYCFLRLSQFPGLFVKVFLINLKFFKLDFSTFSGEQ